MSHLVQVLLQIGFGTFCAKKVGSTHLTLPIKVLLAQIGCISVIRLHIPRSVAIAGQFLHVCCHSEVGVISHGIMIMTQ